MSKKWITWVVVMLCVFACTVFLILKTNKVEEPKTNNEQMVEITQKELNAYVEEMVSKNKQYEIDSNAYLTYMKENDVKGAREAALKAHNEAKKLEALYASYDAPKGSPEYMLTIFEGAGSELSVAYAVRAEAFDTIITYLGTKDQSELEEANRKFTESETYIKSGMDSLERAKLY